MGMILGLNTLSDKNIGKVLIDPPLIWKVIAPDDPEIYEEERKSITPTGFFSRILKKMKSCNKAQSITSLIELTDNEGEDTDLDKAWHGIHYMLTGSVWEGDDPINFLIAGGETVGKIDVGYGPARCIKSENIRRINEILSRISIEDFKSKFEPDKMMTKEIYPEIWEKDNEDGNLDYLIEYFEELKHFISKAVENNMGVIISIC